MYRFRLYIAGNAMNSVQAVANLVALCKTYLVQHHEIEIVDVLKKPERALADNIFMTPALVKLTPDPPTQIIGTLAQTESVLNALGMKALEP